MDRCSAVELAADYTVATYRGSRNTSTPLHFVSCCDAAARMYGVSRNEVIAECNRRRAVKSLRDAEKARQLTLQI